MSDPTDPLAWVTRAEEDLALARSALRRKVPLRRHGKHADRPDRAALGQKVVASEAIVLFASH
jgi:hypothetical protein